MTQESFRIQEQIIDLRGEKLYSGDKAPYRLWESRPLSKKTEEKCSRLANRLLEETHKSIIRNYNDGIQQKRPTP